ncbi:gamma-glutamyltransferase family protein [Pseudorhodoferax sp.]|uniref:gamma-glutamyltransferase family protein n=1 Tax=Pseudorhodoferax sp. TaxID=1993553 RepID=UPI002DD6322B|nr:gamma-glutamyltransferase family protein [Pseudorhodoferax sp.]
MRLFPSRAASTLRHLAAAWAAVLALLLQAGCTTAPTSAVAVLPAVPALPEGPSGYTAKPGWAVQRLAVAAAHPLAAEAGYRVLKAGGSAIDAAVAVQMVLALVEPQSSGIGGGAFLLHWDGRTVQAWDGRETAPAAADEALFLRPDGRPMPMAEAVVGGRAVGVPGVVRMLEQVHRAQGRLPWAELFAPAIELAEQGFAVGARMHTQLGRETALKQDAQAAAYFFAPDGRPHPVGHRLRNPALAEVLRALAARGSVALHEGPVAADIVARVRGHANNPGRLSMADLAGYRAVQREPLCTDWLAVYRVCGMPPPSSGHLAVMQILGLLAHGAVAEPPQAPLAPDWLHRYTEAARLAFADRALYVADPAFVAAPGGDWSRLLDEGYLRRRAALIGPRRADVMPAGVPEAGPAAAWAPMADQPEHGTSHISIVDAEGRAVAMTTSIEAAWGARMLSDGGTGKPGGFLLNNQLTDFALAPAYAQGRPVANRVQPGKRPRSSMSPTLVFDRRDGRLLMTLGSPGGAAIIHFTAKALVATLAWELGLQQAIALPNFAPLGGPLLLERGRFAPATVQALQARGHPVDEVDLTSGLQAVMRTPGGWFGAADPRREGVVVGE